MNPFCHHFRFCARFLKFKFAYFTKNLGRIAEWFLNGCMAQAHSQSFRRDSRVDAAEAYTSMGMAGQQST